VAGWLLLAPVLVLWAFTLRPAELGGPATYVVVSGDSMEPVLSDGDLVVARERARYAVDDVAVFPVPEGEPGGGSLVIHRIVGIDGERFVMQGDNRDRVDDWTPRPAQVRGAMWLHVPGGGQMLMAVLRPPVLAAVTGGLATVWLLTRESASKPARDDA
jgi:hypothetical protein